MPLNTAQLDSAKRWIATLDEQTRERGQNFFRAGRIFDLEPYQRGIGWRARISGDTGMYNTKVRYAGYEWESECNCPVRRSCKHGAALMFAVLGQPNDEPVDTKARARQFVANIQNERAPFTKELSERLVRKLVHAERDFAEQMDVLYQHHRRLATVPRYLLTQLAAARPRAGEDAWQNVTVWPGDPAAPWEMWLYLAAWMRRENLPLPVFMRPLTDWTEVDALIGPWERAQRIERWQDWLDKTSRQTAAAAEKKNELRVRLTPESAHLEWRKEGIGEFKPVPEASYRQFVNEGFAGRAPFDSGSLPVWLAFNTGYGSEPVCPNTSPDGIRILNTLLRRDETLTHVVGTEGKPIVRSEETLAWRVENDDSTRADYRIALVRPDGSMPPPALIVLDGSPSLYITSDTIFHGPPLGGLEPSEQIEIPAEALETAPGVALLERIGVPAPPRVASRVRSIKLRPVFHCELVKNGWNDGENLHVRVFAESDSVSRDEHYTRDGWQPIGDSSATKAPGQILRANRNDLASVPDLIAALKLKWQPYGENLWHKPAGKQFPQQFSEWLAALPPEATVQLDPMLASLRSAPVKATVKLEVEGGDIDWFDIKIALDVADTTLTKAEIKALLDARGGFVRLGAKGWKRLAFELSPEDEAQLADLGLSARDFSAQPQRLHALQLAGKAAAKKLLGEEHARAIERRAEEIRTRVTPALPAGILAELRPYQIEGYHFLAYLSANRFGGILADDMGLGKTLQTLSWMLWVRSEANAARGKDAHPFLVVCPKSVVDNWRSESTRFAPELRVVVLPRGSEADDLANARKGADLVVANYAQLRILEAELTAVPWSGVILDEAQAIKNPDSATARAAWSLKTTHRLALSGTPIENRLLDLWSIMQFAMPGVLGNRAAFGKTFDQRNDPLARRRLSARVRPFVLRRTKGEVAKDLPDRIEEDLLCELDGAQATLYRAELKRARAALLGIQSKAQLDQSRFNILASLLRLRQICCHPALIGASKRKAAKEPKPTVDENAIPESAKLSALIDVLEPLIAEGHKVLVFSQFVEMLQLIRAELVAREWKHFMLTGETEERGPLVADFQSSEGSAVFLISLRAGGFGLNLTAASYVVLYDPWWNPAVENQAIDRTHRIGQVNKVIAYRLLVKDTIEEKIRSLQKQKSNLAADILGEEAFARTLTIEDFQFLFSE